MPARLDAVLPDPVRAAVDHFLRRADALLPGRVSAFYVVGSTALGAYREGRSDVDFVAVVDGELDHRRLRALQAASAAWTSARALRHRLSPLSGTCNGVFVRSDDLTKPVSDVAAAVAFSGTGFHVEHRGSDVSPVAWKTWLEHGITVRGPEPAALGLDPEPDRLVPWNLDNLRTYWRPWAAAARNRRPLRPGFATAWGALGPVRLHRTITTGDIVSKEAAGEYALDVFDPRWHPLVRDGLAWVRREPPVLRLPARERAGLAADFVEVVADSAGA